MGTLVSSILVGVSVVGVALFAVYDERTTKEREPNVISFREYLGALFLPRDC